MKLDGIATFVAIAEAGSISEAARRLRLSKSVVSERLAELEPGPRRKPRAQDDAQAVADRGPSGVPGARRRHREGRRPSAKLRALVDSLRQSFGDPPYSSLGDGPDRG